MLTLYYSEKSCSFAPHILLYDTGADFAAKRIDFGTGEQNSEGYLSVNPKGRVPAPPAVFMQRVLFRCPYRCLSALIFSAIR